MANKAEKFVARVVAGLEPDQDPVYCAITACEKKLGYDRYRADREVVFTLPPEYKKAINSLSLRIEGRTVFYR